MVVDERGDFLTQRELPKLCLLHTTLSEEGIGLRYPGAGASSLPLRLDEGPRVRARVFDFEGQALEYEGASAWASKALGTTCRFVFMPDDVERSVDPDYARPGDIVSYADGYPVLLASTSSLDDLNGRLTTPVTMTRFRPNVVVEGAGPFAEDRWRRLRFGGVEWRNATPCGRCQVITVDPETGEKSVEPLRTLSTYRRQGNSVMFAASLIPESEGVVRVGDTIEVLEEGELR